MKDISGFGPSVGTPVSVRRRTVLPSWARLARAGAAPADVGLSNAGRTDRPDPSQRHRISPQDYPVFAPELPMLRSFCPDWRDPSNDSTGTRRSDTHRFRPPDPANVGLSNAGRTHRPAPSLEIKALDALEATKTPKFGGDCPYNFFRASRASVLLPRLTKSADPLVRHTKVRHPPTPPRRALVPLKTYRKSPALPNNAVPIPTYHLPPTPRGRSRTQTLHRSDAVC